MKGLPYGMPSCLVANLAISCGSLVPAASMSNTARQSRKRDHSRSTRLSDRSVNVKARLGHSTTALLWLNGFLLFWVSLIPLATALVGSEPRRPLAAACYGGVLALTSVGLTARAIMSCLDWPR